jgi:arginine decarboxylase-like protein
MVRSSRMAQCSALVIDAYHDLAEALRAAAGQPAGLEPRAGLRRSLARTGPGRWPSRTGTGCRSGRRCPATTRTRNDSWRPRKPQ